MVYIIEIRWHIFISCLENIESYLEKVEDYDYAKQMDENLWKSYEKGVDAEVVVVVQNDNDEP